MSRQPATMRAKREAAGFGIFRHQSDLTSPTSVSVHTNLRRAPEAWVGSLPMDRQHYEQSKTQGCSRRRTGLAADQGQAVHTGSRTTFGEPVVTTFGCPPDLPNHCERHCTCGLLKFGDSHLGTSIRQHANLLFWLRAA